MASVVLTGDTSGTVTLSAPAVAGSTTISFAALSGDNLVDIARSLTGNGYVKLSNGLVIQWGTWSGTGVHGTSYSFTFPIAFPTSCFGITSSVQQGVATNTTVVYLPVTALSTTGATLQYGAINGGGYTYSYRYIAIGN